MVKRTGEEDRYEIVVVVHMLVWDEAGESLLLLERANTGLMDSRLTLPGGHLQRDESIVAAAHREVREEVGIDLLGTEPWCVLPYSGGVNFVFSSRSWQGQVVNAEPSRCAGVGWYAKQKLPENAVPWLTKALQLNDSGHWFYDFGEG